jgi:hypothetical protein
VLLNCLRVVPTLRELKVDALCALEQAAALLESRPPFAEVLRPRGVTLSGASRDAVHSALPHAVCEAPNNALLQPDLARLKLHFIDVRTLNDATALACV